MLSVPARLCICSIALVLLTGVPRMASAQPVADYFRNKTVRVLIPGSPGAGSALHVVTFVNSIKRHLPGNPTVIPQYMPGAGGASAINYLYNVAAGDPLTLAMPFASVVIAQVTGDASVKYDVTKLNWIGRINDLTRVFFVWHTVKAANLLDLRATSIVVGATARVSETFINPSVMNHTLGTRLKIVTGYKAAAAVNLAVEARETDGATGTWENLRISHAAWLQDRKVRILAQIGLAKDRTLADIPLLRDLADNEADRALIDLMASSSQVGNTLVAPPGLATSIVDALRTAFDNTMRDPEYLEMIRKRNIVLNKLNGLELTDVIRRTVSAPPNVIGRYKRAIEAQ